MAFLALRIRAALAIPIAAATVAMVACNSAKPRTAPAATPAPFGAATGYLLVQQDQVLFVQWTNAANQLNGRVQGLRDSGYPDYTAETIAKPFTGQIAGANLSLAVDQGEHVTETWTGTLSGDSLALVTPNDQGFLQTWTLHTATVDDYNTAAAAFRNGVAARQTVVGDDRALGVALTNLSTATQKLAADTRFGDVTKSFDGDLATLQTDLQTVQATAAPQPFDCSQYGVLQTQRGAVARALTQVRTDDGSLSTTATTVNDDIGTVKGDIVAVQTAAQAQSDALGKAVAFAVPVHNTVTAATSAVTGAQAQIDASTAAMNAAQGQYGGYLSQATGLDQQAEQTVSAISCAPPTPAPTAPASAPLVRGGSGSYEVVTPADGVNVRPQPGASSRTGCLTQGAIVYITDGPQVADNQSWVYAHNFGWISSAYLAPTTQPTAQAGSPDAVVRAFYDALDRHDLVAAWNLTSRGYHAAVGGDFASWSANFATTQSVIAENTRTLGNQVSVNFVTVDAGVGARQWSTTWTLVDDGAGLRLDHSATPAQLPVCG